MTQLKSLRSNFDSDFNIEVHLGANNQDFKENSLRGQMSWSRVTQLRSLRSNFDSDFTIEVNLGANSQFHH